MNTTIPVIYTNGKQLGVFELDAAAAEYVFLPVPACGGFYTQDVLSWLYEQLERTNWEWSQRPGSDEP